MLYVYMLMYVLNASTEVRPSLTYPYNAPLYACFKIMVILVAKVQYLKDGIFNLKNNI